MRAVVLVGAACLLLAAQCVAESAAKDDLKRARTKKPRDSFKGEDQSEMSKVLNGHLTRKEKHTLPCEHWSTEQLQKFLATIADHRNDDLQKIYSSSQDRRAMHATSRSQEEMEYNQQHCR
jgi:hypothetical protein